jgi:hypothetical protein
MSAIHIDTEGWPIAVIKFEGVPSDRECDNHLRRLSNLLERREPWVTIIDASRAGITPNAHRRKQAEWVSANDASLRSYSLGVAFVFTSPVFRFVLSTIVLIQPLPMPYTICATLGDALRWARQRVIGQHPSSPPRPASDRA